MIKMVNRLSLKRTIIRRFVNESDDDEDEDQSYGSEIEIISANGSTKSENSFIGLDSSPSDDSKNNNKYTNYKIFVRNYGQTVERFVDINGDSNPFVVNHALDQVMACHHLNEIVTLQTKTPSNAHSNVSVPQQREEELNPKFIPNKDKSEAPNVKTSDSKEFETKVKELESEGIRYLKKKKTALTFKCLICDIKVIGIQLASDHSRSDFHFKRIFGDHLKGIDALFTIDSETIGSVEIAIACRRQLNRISSIDKQRYVEHGIRLKDGFGSNAFICSKCNLSFASVKDVDKHIKSFDTNISEPKDCESHKPTATTISSVDQKLYSEGIKATESSDGSKFYCIFCNIYFDCKRITVSHISDTRHKKQKRGENLNEIDSRFTIESNRIDELEVAFARKTMLKTIPPKTKMEFTQQYIRLEDGMGSNAFKCLKCIFALASVEDIQIHINSLIHKM